MALPEVRIVAFYRTDAWPRMRRVLVIGPLALTLGGAVVALAFSTHVVHDLRVLFAIAGFALVAGGAVFTMVGMQIILRDDASVTLRTDGLAVQTATGEQFVRWDALEGARWDGAPPALVLRRRDAEPLVLRRKFADIAGDTLAQEIERTRRRAAMGMLG